MCEMLTVSERRACRVLGQVRRTQRYASILSDDETALVAHVVSLATEYGRYGYRRIDLPPHMYPHPELGCGC